MIHKDTPAFPHTMNLPDVVAAHPGMTLRQYYAGEIMVAHVSHVHDTPDHAARVAVKAADALIAELNRTETP